MEWVPVSTVAMLEGVSPRSIERRIKKSEYRVRQAPSSKQRGKFITEIAVSSLPVNAQAKWLDSQTPTLPQPLPMKGGDVSQDKSPRPTSRKGENCSSDSGTGLVVSNTERALSPQDHAVWYQSLKPEHLTVIEKRQAIVEAIGRAVEASTEKNKTALITDLARNHRISNGTYYRWKKAHETHGMYGLRVKSFGSSRSKLREEQKKYILALIRFNPDCRNARIWEYVIDEFPNNPVSGATVSRFVRQWKKENPDVFEWLRNPDAWKNKYALAFGSQSEKARHFLHYVELDSTPADLMCNDGKRYTIIGGIDIYSRKVKCYVSPSSSGMGVAGLIRSVITDWGVPENFVRDNGKDYVCNQVNTALENLAVNAITLPPFSPEKKPHIERFFRSMSMSLFEESAGYIGHNVADRKAIESRRTFAKRMMNQGSDPIRLNLTAEGLQNLIDQWIENIYHQRVHSGIGTTPENKAAQSTVPIRRVEDERALDILLLPCGTRTVQSFGISYENGKYQSPQFASWVGKQVHVRRDIENAGALYVFDMGHNYICTAVDSSLIDMTTAEHKAAQKLQRQRVREKVNAIELLTESPMARRLNQSQAGKKLVGLNRTRAHNTPALEQAGNAALERNGIQPPQYRTIAEQMENTVFNRDAFELADEDEDPLAFMERIRIVNDR